jgi:hypothetical protein
MPAINIVCDHRRVHILTDSAFCNSDGTINRIVSRILPSRMSDGVVLAHDLAGLNSQIGIRFESFDEAIVRIAPELFSHVNVSNAEASPCLLYLAGWSQQREETEAYAISTHQTVLTSWDQDTREPSRLSLTPYKLFQLPQYFLSPAPDPTALEAAAIGSFHLGWRSDRLLREIQKIITAQRHSQYGGHHIVGGFAEGQRVDVNWGGIWWIPDPPEIVWADDHIGELIIPRATDWEMTVANFRSPHSARSFFFRDSRERLSTWPAALQRIRTAYAQILGGELSSSQAHRKDYRFSISSGHNLGEDEYSAVQWARTLKLKPSTDEMKDYEQYVNRVLGDIEKMKEQFRLQELDPEGFGIATLHGISRKLAAVLRD